MLRFIFWIAVWVATLGLLDIDVSYSDGLHVKLRSWLRKGRDPR